MNRAVFIDRDGVLIEDVHLLTKPEQISVIEGVPETLSALKRMGYQLIVVSNQTVVARGLCKEADVREVHRKLDALLEKMGGVPIDHYFFCPHHPNADLIEYRKECSCRKPKPGMLQQAAETHDIDLRRSFMVGDRVSDIAAGVRAGCRTIQVLSGEHEAVAIEAPEEFADTKPEHVCSDLKEAAAWIGGVA